MASPPTYDLNVSRANVDILQAILMSPLEADLESVPGIGPRTKELLFEDGVTTTYQLIAKFLSFRGKSVSTRSVCDSFEQYLAAVGVKGWRNCITEYLCDIVKAHRKLVKAHRKLPLNDTFKKVSSAGSVLNDEEQRADKPQRTMLDLLCYICAIYFLFRVVTILWATFHLFFLVTLLPVPQKVTQYLYLGIIIAGLSGWL